MLRKHVFVGFDHWSGNPEVYNEWSHWHNIKFHTIGLGPFNPCTLKTDAASHGQPSPSRAETCSSCHRGNITWASPNQKTPLSSVRPAECSVWLSRDVLNNEKYWKAIWVLPLSEDGTFSSSNGSINIATPQTGVLAWRGGGFLLPGKSKKWIRLICFPVNATLEHADMLLFGFTFDKTW